MRVIGLKGTGTCTGTAAGAAMLAGAAIYAVLWVTIGKIDEVRIFLPLALGLAPLTAEMAMLHVSSEAQG